MTIKSIREYYENGHKQGKSFLQLENGLHVVQCHVESANTTYMLYADDDGNLYSEVGMTAE